MIEAKQIRAARALLDWTREDLAKASDVSVPALSQIETEHRTARTGSLEKIKTALETAGVLFTDNSGVKLRGDLVTVFENAEGYKAFADDLYLTALRHGGTFYLSGGFQEDFHRNLGEEFLTMHSERMQALKDFRVMMIKPQSRSDETTLPYIEYRVVPDQMFFDVPFYVYHDKLAIILWEPKIKIVILRDEHAAAAYAKQFNVLWRLAKKPGRSEA